MSSQVWNLWLVAVQSAFYAIWFARNQSHFNGLFIPLARSLAFIWASVKEANSIQLGTMDNSFVDLGILRRIGVSGVVRKVSNIVTVVWHTPPVGWIKVNTDGAALGSPGAAGCGGFFSSSSGSVLGCFVVPLGSCFAFESELLGVIVALEYACAHVWGHLWVECDSLYVVNLLRTRGLTVPGIYKARWRKCLSFISSIQFAVSHIYREGNGVADALSKYVVTASDAHWWSTLPSFCSGIHSRNVLGQENYRFT